MHIPRIWESQSVQGVNPQGRPVHATGWGWSESSHDEARTKARQAADRVLQWLLNNQADREPSRYGYDERLPREEIIKEFADEHGETLGFVSRNQYGSLILNTRDLMFIDVDIPPAPPNGVVRFLKGLFGSKQKAEQPDPAEDLLGQIREIASRHADSGIRIYRTHSGFRLMLTDEPVLADSPRAQALLREFQADPLYVRMCKHQQCFRARLTPKAWRCRVSNPPVPYPFADAHAEATFRAWEKQYSAGVQPFSTCQLLDRIGPDAVHPSFAELVELHDRLCKVTASDPLA